MMAVPSELLVRQHTTLRPSFEIRTTPDSFSWNKLLVLSCILQEIIGLFSPISRPTLDVLVYLQ